MADFSTALTTGASAAMDSISSLDQRQQGSGDKTAGAAKDFEALLLGQMLKSARGDGGWLGTDDDDAGEAAVGLGEEQLARVMAQSGGLGLSRMIESGIRSGQNAVDTLSPAGKLPVKP
jgi:Rod binding domain-containing protein